MFVVPHHDLVHTLKLTWFNTQSNIEKEWTFGGYWPSLCPVNLYKWFMPKKVETKVVKQSDKISTVLGVS